jgi:hypothetical protein
MVRHHDCHSLHAHQALGDMVGRVARVWRVDKPQNSTAQYTIDTAVVRRLYDESPNLPLYCVDLHPFRVARFVEDNPWDNLATYGRVRRTVSR